MPATPAALGAVIREVVRRNRVTDGIVYLQVTRGVAPRNHAFPSAGVPPGIVVTARATDRAAANRGGGRRVGHHRSGQSLGPGRHQDDFAPAQRPRQAEGDGSRRLRGLVRRPRGPGHRGRFDQRLDRHPRRPSGDAAGRPRHSSRHHAGGHLRSRREGRAAGRGSGLHRGGSARFGAKPSSPRPRPWSCRSCASTGCRSPTASPAPLRSGSGRCFMELPRRRPPGPRRPGVREINA